MRVSPPRLAAVLGATLAGVGAGAFGGAEASRPEPPTVAGVVDLTVVARITERGAPAAWTATASVASRAPVELPEPPMGVCRRVAASERHDDGPVVDTIRLTGPIRGALAWSEADRGWYTRGPQQVVDAAWAVGDVEIDVDGARVRVEDAVRFGALPRVTSLARGEDGSVALGWDPSTVDRARVVTAGPAGELECGTGNADAELPWWSVPALGGSVVLQNVRERVTVLPTGVVVRVRAVVERIVPLDVPPATVEEAGPAPAPTPGPVGPRHSNRRPRPTFG